MGKKILIGSNNTRICMPSFAYMDLLPLDFLASQIYINNNILLHFGLFIIKSFKFYYLNTLLVYIVFTVLQKKKSFVLGPYMANTSPLIHEVPQDLILTKFKAPT